MIVGSTKYPCVEGRLGHPPAACQNRSAVPFRALDRREIRLDRRFVDDRPHPDVAFERIADFDLLRLLDQQRHEFVAHAFLNVDARARRAFLSLRAERRPHHAVARLVEIGGRRDDGGILSAHLDDQRPRHRARGVVAHQLQPTSFDPVKTMPSMPGLSISSCPAVAPRPGDEIEDARRQPGLDGISFNLAPDNGVALRRLEDDRIARRERAACGSRGQRHRKIERGDHGPHAVRPQDAEVLFAGASVPIFSTKPLCSSI